MSLRARQLDIHRRLSVVKSLDELDKNSEGVSRQVTHGHHALDAENEEALTVKTSAGVTEIPTPPVLDVPSYGIDYRPTFRQPAAYLRSGTTGSTLRVDCNLNLPSTSIPLVVPTAGVERSGALHDPLAAAAAAAIPGAQGGATVTLPAAPVDLRDAYMVEYDLDESDEHWLHDFNGTQTRISPVSLEYCLWKLECAWAEAQEQVLGKDASGADGTGGGTTGGGGHGGAHTAGIGIKNASMLLSPDYLDRERACMDSLKNSGVRLATRFAIYSYWLSKRKTLGRPMLRRLIPPPSISDNNPYNVFHPREKAHRPQTRRRHVDGESALDKAKDMKRNFEAGRALLDHVYRRERKKLELALCQADYRRALVAQKHDGKAAVEALADQLGKPEANSKRASAAGVAAAVVAVQKGGGSTKASGEMAPALQNLKPDTSLASDSWNAAPAAALQFGGDYKRRADAILECARPTSVFRRPLFSIKKRKKEGKGGPAAAAAAAAASASTAAKAMSYVSQGVASVSEPFPFPLEGKPLLPPEFPGEAPEPCMPFLQAPSWEILEAALGQTFDEEERKGLRPRYGRGGRIILDRVYGPAEAEAMDDEEEEEKEENAAAA